MKTNKMLLMNEDEIFKMFVKGIAKGETVQLHAFPVQLRKPLKSGFIESEKMLDCFVIRKTAKRGAKTNLLKIAGRL